MMQIKKWWPTIVTAIGGLVGFLTPSVQAYASAHPAQTVAVMGAWAIVCHQFPAPWQGGK